MSGGKSSKEKGKWGELLAQEYLIRKGYAILETNYRPGASHLEVDIIAQQGTDMVFVEVKTRTNPEEDPAEAVDLKKMRFMAYVADNFIRNQPIHYNYRFDIIAVNGTPEDYELRHIKDAFLAPLNTKR